MDRDILHLNISLVLICTCRLLELERTEEEETTGENAFVFANNQS